MTSGGIGTETAQVEEKMHRGRFLLNNILSTGGPEYLYLQVSILLGWERESEELSVRKSSY